MNKPASLKLLKLKEWWILPDAAKHLSVVCGEEVTVADILKLALDGHLKLSVNFVYGTKAVPVISIEGDGPLPVINSGDVVMEISGVWDLCMRGAMKQNIEYEFLRLIGGPAPVGFGVSGFFGIFVEGQNGKIYQLQMELIPNDYVQDGLNESTALYSGNISLDELKETISRHEEQWKPFCQSNATIYPHDIHHYHVAHSLPQDSILIVRTEALTEFEQIFSDKKPEDNERTYPNTKPLSIQRANDYNECIAQVMADFADINGYAPTTIEEVINRMKYRPPLGYNVEFQNSQISIDGATPKPIANMERAIRRLLKLQK